MWYWEFSVFALENLIFEMDVIQSLLSSTETACSRRREYFGYFYHIIEQDCKKLQKIFFICRAHYLELTSDLVAFSYIEIYLSN